MVGTVYSEKQLSLARASDAEMKQISVSKVDAAKQSSAGDSSQWSAEDLKLARISVPTIITFTNKYGDIVSNAAVRIYETGVSIIWEKGASGGVVMLVDLPEDFRERFGYDPVKANAAASSVREKQERWQQALAAQAAQLGQQSQDTAPSRSIGVSEYQYGGGYSEGGSVYVHGYTRSNGTYVNGYTRSR
jgi:hypothetical protein